MPNIPLKERTSTERVVYQLRRAAAYIELHAEDIVGNIDPPIYIADGLSFRINIDHEGLDTIEADKKYIVI